MHGVVGSVSRAPHQLQHHGMGTTLFVAFRSSGATKRFWLFASIIFDHELKKLAPRTVLHHNKIGSSCGQGIGAFCGVFWPGTFCNGPFCGQDFLRTGHSVSGPSCTPCDRPFGSIVLLLL